MNVVQVRLVRKILLRLIEQGFVEYVVLMLFFVGGRLNYLVYGVDMDWFLVGNRIQSVYCYCGDYVRDSM